MTLSMFYACKFSGWYFSGMAHRLLSKAFCASFHITSPTEMAHFLDHRLGVQFWPSQAVYGGRWGLYRSDLLLNFFLFPFCKKSLICPEGKSMTPRRRNTILFRSSQQLPRLRLGPSKGFLSWHGALLKPSTQLMRCFRNYRDTRTLSGVPRWAQRS